MRWTLLPWRAGLTALMVLVPAMAGGQAPASPASLTFGIVATCGTAGTSLPKPAPRGPVCLRNTFSVQPGDIQKLELTTDVMGLSALTTTFAAAASDGLRRLTEANIGRQLAILVDDDVVAVPYIRTPFSSEMQISGPERPALEKLSRQLGGRSAP